MGRSSGVSADSHRCCKVGLTGGIACGKTLVTDYFATRGVPVLDADEIARGLVEPEQPAWYEIREVFGDTVLNPDGRLNRVQLRTLIFNDKTARRQLEAILHPRIRRQMESGVVSFQAAYCILSIPLLVETRQTAWMDRVLVTDCSRALQYQRLATRDGLDSPATTRILSVQCSREERLKYADDIIYNNGSKAEVEKQVGQLHQFYLTWASSKRDNTQRL